MIDTGNSTFGNNNLDKVRDSNLNNENKKIETIKLFCDTINDKNMELMRNYRFT